MSYGIVTSGLQMVAGVASGGPSAPSGLYMDLQGQTAQNLGSGPQPGSNDFIPHDQSFTHMIWTQGTPGGSAIVSNRIRRRVNQGSRSSYAVIPVATSYGDVAAPVSVGYPAGIGPNFYPGNGYGYTVTAIDALGNESAESAPMTAPYFLGGLQVLNGGDFSGSGMVVVYNNTTGPMMPGRTTNVKMTTNGAFGDAVVYAGNGATQWNLNLANYNFINMWVAAGQAGSSLQFAPLRVGDVPIHNSTQGQLVIPSSTYATLISGTYVLVKIPLNVFLMDWTSGSPVQQTSWYKTNFQDTSSTIGNVYYVGDWYWSET